MHPQNSKHRVVVAALMLVSSLLIAGCSESRMTEPTSSRSVTPSHHASLDDDPNTCRSGYTMIDGHVVCN